MTTLNAVGDKLNEASAAIETISNHDEKLRYRTAVAELMIDVYIKLMRPIVREHEDLDPDRDIV